MPRTPWRFVAPPVAAALVAAVVVAGAPAAGAAAAGPVGHLTAARQDTVTRTVTVAGSAYDTARPSASILVKVYVGGHYAGRIRTVARTHRFRLGFAWPGKAAVVTVRSRGLHSAHRVTLDDRAVRQVVSPPGQRIVAVAKRFVGHARYVEGGEWPRTGFDCSGYTKYVYAKARVARLPHNAEAQRRMRGMRIVPARAARPGDLVFYLSGGSAYHVAIYAGHGKQYAAATPRDGIVFQPVWSSAVQYGTLRH